LLSDSHEALILDDSAQPRGERTITVKLVPVLKSFAANNAPSGLGASGGGSSLFGGRGFKAVLSGSSDGICTKQSVVPSNRRELRGLVVKLIERPFVVLNIT
jgi:hypothetical protein